MVTVLQDWVVGLPFQQQSVLMSALRGPDGIGKYHPMKIVVRAYRASILKAATTGKVLTPSDQGDTFMDIRPMFDVPIRSNGGFTVTDQKWKDCVRDYYRNVDELPHHYHLHMLHGAQIAGYHHSNYEIRNKWASFYFDGVEDMHLYAESQPAMNERLNDFGTSPGGVNGH